MSDTDTTERRDREDWHRGPLTDVRVLDLTQMLAGPYATMLLADLGADVVKIESPAGDMIRSNPPHVRDGEAYGGYFHSVNRNKRGVVLNLKTDDGKATFERLVEDADVVIENFSVGTMEGLGLSYETLRDINPGLVYASIRGFGDPRLGESPYADRPAFDLIAQAMGGIMSITGTEESGPTKVGPGVGDIFPAVLSVVGILAALTHRDRTGEGQHVDVGMVDSILALTERIVYQYSIEGTVPAPQGNSHPLLFPFDRFSADDGYVVIAAPTDSQWEALCEHIDRPDLSDRYRTNEDRVAASDYLYPLINEWTRAQTKHELFELLADDVPCGPVQTIEEIFSDPHFATREMLPEVAHADSGETVRLAGTPIKLSKTPGGVQRRAPFLGEHTRDVLEAAGYDEHTIEELVASGAASGWEPSDSPD